jgi:hypothetical protein
LRDSVTIVSFLLRDSVATVFLISRAP